MLEENPVIQPMTHWELHHSVFVPMKLQVILEKCLHLYQTTASGAA